MQLILAFNSYNDLYNKLYTLMAERAGLSRTTIGKIERGDPATSMGGYAAVLFVLGMENRLSDLVDGAHDLIGRRLEDEKLPQRVRIPRGKR